jgi:uncharacterized glyoxalase superfamily protein PhnB
MAQAVYYRDPQAAIAWLCTAFDFEIRLKVEGANGEIVHSELTYGDGMVMVGGTGRTDPKKEPWQKLQTSPLDAGGGNTQSVCVFVDDCDAHHARAVEHGANIIRAPRTEDYGDDYWSDRTYGATDPEGHLWWFMQRVKTSGKEA